METPERSLAHPLRRLRTRFPLGSGINGNLSVRITRIPFPVPPASLWEVESMETYVFCNQKTAAFQTRFPLGSGINGNLYGLLL